MGEDDRDHRDMGEGKKKWEGGERKEKRGISVFFFRVI